jgi:hypothetical protein
MQAIQDNPKCVEAIYNLGLSMRGRGTQSLPKRSTRRL